MIDQIQNTFDHPFQYTFREKTMKTSALTRSRVQYQIIRSLGFCLIAVLIPVAMFSNQPASRVAAATNATCTSQADADWSAGSTWDCGHAPTNADDVVIINQVTISGNQFVHNLNISSTGILQFITINTLTVSGDFFVDSFGIFDPGNVAASSTSTVVFVGANPTITTNGNWVDFWDLTDNTPDATLSIDPGMGGLHILNTLTLNGTAGHYLKLRSTVQGSQASIWPENTVTANYVDVQDSNNVSLIVPTIAPAHGIDSGNNTGWVLFDTRTGLTSNLNPSLPGISVTFTATITPPAASGTVAFQDGGANITGCSSRPLNAGVATCSTSSLSSGPHSITAIYSGDLTYTGSTSAPYNQVVRITTTTALGSSANPSNYLASVTFTATVTPAPTGGTVTFLDGATTLCNVVALSGASATCANILLSVGPHTIHATFSGDANYATSTTTFSQTVNQAATTTNIGSSGTPSILGQSVTFTATVSPPPSGGTVDFLDGASTLCSAASLAGATATCSTNSLAVGSHSITAVYSGDANYLTSTSSGFNQVVVLSASSTVLSSSKTPSTYGEPITITATVTPPAATGTVTFKEGAVNIAGCVAISLTNGLADCPVSSLVTGSHDISAVYSGDSLFATSTSIIFTQQVSQAITATTINTDLATPTLVNQTITVTVTVSIVGAGGGAPTGNVTIGDGVATCTAAVTAGTATCNLTFNTPGKKVVTASFTNADGNYLNSISAPVNHTVNTLRYLPMISK
jgi:hypothetical protein